MRKLFSLVLILGLFTSGAEAKIFRSSKAKHEFMRLSGYPKGRPGYVIDHIIPLCAGGLDAPSNMPIPEPAQQWQHDAGQKRNSRGYRDKQQGRQPQGRWQR